MADKEPTVERRHREVTALALKSGTDFRASELEWIADGGGSVAPSWERVAQALASAEAAASERAWDEGYVTGREHALAVSLLMDLGKAPPSPPVNPYRQPPKGDDDGR